MCVPVSLILASSSVADRLQRNERVAWIGCIACKGPGLSKPLILISCFMSELESHHMLCMHNEIGSCCSLAPLVPAIPSNKSISNPGWNFFLHMIP